MRFSSGARAGNAGERLDEFARALEPRVERAGLPPPAPAERLRLLFVRAAASKAELDLLRGAPGAELGDAGAGLARLAIDPARLDELAPRTRVARALAATAEAACVPPAPARVMGIVNVTPDSFSDGGEWLESARAIEHGRALIAEGAEILDVGGESTRPGSAPVALEVELERVLPVVTSLARDGGAVLSVDTTKAAVARAALDAGAEIVNDVSAGRADPEMLPLVAARGAGIVLMHMRGSPRDMQTAPRYSDVVREVAAFLRERAHAAVDAGIDPACIALDPGIGFGKDLEHNLALVRGLAELRSLGFPLVLGASRKSFLGRLSGETVASKRGPETTAAVTLAAYFGAEIHRVHEVAPARAALRVARAFAAPEGTV